MIRVQIHALLFIRRVWILNIQENAVRGQLVLPSNAGESNVLSKEESNRGCPVRWNTGVILATSAFVAREQPDRPFVAARSPAVR